MTSLHAVVPLRIHSFESTAPGPRLIVLGGVHGDETCGTVGIERVLAELDGGTFPLLRGTLTALSPIPLFAMRRKSGNWRQSKHGWRRVATPNSPAAPRPSIATLIPSSRIMPFFLI